MATSLRWGILLGTIAMAFLAGRSVGPSAGADSWLTALATALLTVIAGIQVTREVAEASERTEAQRQRLLPHAWLARRNCLAAAEEAETLGGQEWLRRHVSTLDIIETRLVTTVSLAAELGAGEAAAARLAFSRFLEAADIVVRATDPRRGYGPEQMTQARNEAGPKYREVALALEPITGTLSIPAGSRPATNEPGIGAA